MLQLSLDGHRLYVTNSLFSSWDDQFYPNIKKNGSYLIKINCDNVNGGMEIDEDFYVDFGKLENGPYRGHETRYPMGDCTSDIFLADL
jgi:selenium-binding protein 1